MYKDIMGLENQEQFHEDLNDVQFEVELEQSSNVNYDDTNEGEASHNCWSTGPIAVRDGGIENPPRYAMVAKYLKFPKSFAIREAPFGFWSQYTTDVAVQ
ncbi:hypothetical protein E3N88_14943 [Mikania micrantha]|uniref:Uncharacterized protein n=1 Tax=Mikania micrantha TaxID=192012 RepID=A0A5N6P4U7_9ASTR|nr:hypothetical protein E3N88_14943 [Mikania micrantha]